MGHRLQGPCRRIPGVIYHDDAAASRWYADGSWIDLTMGDALRATAARVPDRIAFASESGHLTFAQLDEQSERLGAALLALGLAPGDRAMFQMGTVLETTVAMLACFKAGIIPVCTIPQYREIEIGQLATLSGAVAYFVQADFSAFDLVGFAQSMQAKLPQLKHLVVARAKGPGAFHDQAALIDGMPLDRARQVLDAVEIGSRDVFAFQLSGGSTGVPKIIPRFHGEYLVHAPHWTRQQGMDEHSIAIWALPILHNAGMIYAIMPCILQGRMVVLPSRVDIPLLLELIQRFRATHAASIGPIAAQLLNFPDAKKYDLSSLRYFVTMSGADRIEQHLGIRATNLYGITEGLVMTCMPDEPVEARHRTVGRPCTPTDEVVIRDVATGEPVPDGTQGELTFRGASSLTGYFNAPELSRETLTPDGFVRTGDLARAHVIDGRTYYAFEGRLKDNINRGGEKFGTEEVEGYIRTHPAIADVAVVAMPDPIMMERACAYVIARPGASVPDVKALGAFLAAKGLAKFKLPERLEVVGEFPVTRVGKLDKARLRAMIVERLKAEGGGG